MRVILSKTVPNLGQAGEIKEVSEGYARNFLLPQGLVKLATEAVIKAAEQSKQKKTKGVVRKTKQYQELAKKINNIKISFTAKADEKKTLYAAVKADRIAEEFVKRGYEVPAQFIKVAPPIKHLGYYDIEINFGTGNIAKVGITITRED